MPVIGDVGGGNENAGWEGDRVAEASEAYECDREDMGTMRFCKFGLDDLGDSAGKCLSGVSGGTSSAAGIGSPLPAATN